MEPVLVKEYRAGIMECSHHGHICIVNGRGETEAFAGDPDFVTFTRSAAKPLQAIAPIRGGIASHYGLNEKEIAIMTASHMAQHDHVEVLESIMKKTGLTESELVCAPSLPLNEESKEVVLRGHGGKRRLYHNCSGKHLGVLAYCKMKGYPLEGYADPGHPVQKEIIETVSAMCGIAPERISLGTDGCGFPVFALPLSAMASAYVKLACPDLIQDEGIREAVTTITRAMNLHPEMVGGSGRVDSLVLQDANFVAKGGFKGVYCFGLKKERLGIAFKVLDGSEEEWGWIVESILEQIGYGNEALIRRLKESFTHDIFNDEGKKVGHAETVFRLQSV
ncbi:asparaginase [Paenibacillus albilobatus]|uniref:Asparaginase n=1 Tax=Paenibacillus albilobatus TaxID=2716884 RepID=A0A920CEZ2_9BACL|nr:asparaginase [Paenibacillus albilobatus]GIO34212.1 asparaginase [Paenibacillus albilobatus]